MGKKRLEAMTISGRDFSIKEFRFIKQMVLLYPHLSRTELTKTISENLSWYQTNGEPKHLACMKVLERLGEWGYIRLPPLKGYNVKGYRQEIKITERTDPGSLVNGRIDEYSPVVIETVREKEDVVLWNEYIARYHYLGYRNAFGSQERYFIRLETGELLGCLLYSASAWSVECRDRWIGWNSKQRAKNLHLIINNSRFLLLPWVRIKNLASKVLSLSARQVIVDWERRYYYRPVLLESFVDPARFSGICYRAANWKYLGVTKGRGRMDYYCKYLSTPKDVFVYPLSPCFREELKGGEQ